MASQRIVLADRPQGAVHPGLFRLENYEPPPVRELEVLVRTLYTSIAPFQRQRMNDVRSYVKPFAIGEVIAADNVCEVLESRHPDFSPGELVIGRLGWQTHAVAPGKALTKIDHTLGEPSLWLSALGSPGLTAYFALFDVALPRPGDVVVVTSAAGAVGGYAGQFAHLAGAEAIGIAGGARKCSHLVQHCGYRAALDYRATDFAQALRQTAGGTVNVFLDLVGGPVADLVFEQLATRARIVLCGRTAASNSERPDLDMANLRYVWVQEATLHSFSLYAYAGRFQEARTRISSWITGGTVRANDHHLSGLEHAPQALCDFVEGRHMGRVIIATD